MTGQDAIGVICLLLVPTVTFAWTVVGNRLDGLAHPGRHRAPADAS